MVPQRAIPFGLVAVLGLNEGEFPRRGADGGLDLMRAAPRLYDREQRSDDRYLFLETVMSARRMLHFSYLGRAVKDGGARAPAAPLAELLALLDAQCGINAEDSALDRPWRVEHPLQPFDRRYFDSSDPRLFSHVDAFAALPAQATLSTLPPFVDTAASAPAALPAQLPLRTLQDFWRDPARQVLAQGLQLHLDALDAQRLPESEALEPRVDARERLTARLFESLLRRGAESRVPAEAPAWLRLSGLLPPGRPGVAAWAQEQARLDALLARLRQVPGFRFGPGESETIDVAIADCRVSGEVHGLHPRAEGGQWLLRAFPRGSASGDKGPLLAEDEVDFRRRLPLFLDWALLRLATARGAAEVQPLRVLALLDDNAGSPWIDALNAWDAALCAAAPTARARRLDALQSRLLELLEHWRAGQGGRLPYLPATSWAALCVPVEAPRSDALPYTERLSNSVESAWHGGEHRLGEADYSPGYARLLTGDLDTAPGSADIERLLDFAHALLACITLQPEDGMD
jgi:exodeoxyribonuclease V gamma subunit